MKHQSLSISIPEPCHEKWSAMTPAEKGRHCKSCQKTVVDFTRMPKVKIAEFVSQQSGSTCGRFSSDQLNVELIPPKPSKTWMKYAAIIWGLVPALGYGQEVTVPEKPIQEMHHPPITGDIVMEKIGEVEVLKTPKVNEIKISGTVIDSDSEKILLDVKMVNHQTNKVKKSINLDSNGHFEAVIPKNSAISISCKGYQRRVLKYEDLESKSDLQITLHRFNPMSMGVVIMKNNIPKTTSEKGKIKITSQSNSKKDKTVEKKEIIQQSVTESLKPNTTRFPKSTIANIDTLESEETLHYLSSTVEIVAYSKNITKGTLVDSFATVTKGQKDSWLKRQWKKFKKL